MSRPVKKVLTDYVNGDIGIVEASKLLKTNRHTITRYVCAIVKHAAGTKKLDCKSIIKNY